MVDTGSFDHTGQFNITNQGYVSAAHEDLEMPAMAAEGTGGNGKAIMLFTLNGTPTAGQHGYYPSTAYGRLTGTSLGLTGSVINIADAGQSPGYRALCRVILQYPPPAQKFPDRAQSTQSTWVIRDPGRITTAPS